MVFADAVILRISCPNCRADRLVYRRDIAEGARPVICIFCGKDWELGQLEVG